MAEQDETFTGSEGKQGNDRTPSGGSENSQGEPCSQTPGGQPQEDVEDRPNVSTVTPEDYPPADRVTGA
jgi:hypothetical protein